MKTFRSSTYPLVFRRHILIVMRNDVIITSWARDKENNLSTRQELNLWPLVHRSNTLTTELRRTHGELGHIQGSFSPSSSYSYLVTIVTTKAFFSLNATPSSMTVSAWSTIITSITRRPLNTKINIKDQEMRSKRSKALLPFKTRMFWRKPLASYLQWLMEKKSRCLEAPRFLDSDTALIESYNKKDNSHVKSI